MSYPAADNTVFRMDIREYHVVLPSFDALDLAVMLLIKLTVQLSVTLLLFLGFCKDASKRLAEVNDSHLQCTVAESCCLIETQNIAFLSGEAAAHRENIDLNFRMLVQLDVIFAKAKLAFHMRAWAPQMNDVGKVELRNARHPLINQKSVVPISLRLGTDFDTMIITGPNTGGKTIAIKTVMLNCIMGQCGLHVTCEQADICMNSLYLCFHFCMYFVTKRDLRQWHIFLMCYSMLLMSVLLLQKGSLVIIVVILQQMIF